MHCKESNGINQRSGIADIWGKIKRIGAVYPKKEHLAEDMITISKYVDSCSKDGRKISFSCLRWTGQKNEGFEFPQGRPGSCGRGKATNQTAWERKALEWVSWGISTAGAHGSSAETVRGAAPGTAPLLRQPPSPVRSTNAHSAGEDWNLLLIECQSN